ncbi:MAG: hypothetical protein CO098_04770 [Bacteroidetes bacterium CG_4_9_14_3_um_filter_41_19]|nr:MAG: hypothetical protein CO098_04770 [Bacteroidetes bacterium CG_4_9_14_3_um_filter_41_19]
MRFYPNERRFAGFSTTTIEVAVSHLQYLIYMKIAKPFTGILAFIIVLITMPLGHATMIAIPTVIFSGTLLRFWEDGTC